MTTKTVRSKSRSTKTLPPRAAKKPRKGTQETPPAPVAPATPAPRLVPPFELTDAETSEILARHRFTGDNVETDTDRCCMLLHELADEIESVAEGIMHTINDRDHGDRQGSRSMADSLLAFARSLGDAQSRMMRYAGRFEAYRDAVEISRDPERMVASYKRGTLGRPMEAIVLGLAGRRAREAEVAP